MKYPYFHDVDEVLQAYNVDPKQGLENYQVQELEKSHGRNELPDEPGTPLLELIIEQFKDQLVIILVISALVSLVLAIFEENSNQLTAYVEPLVIILILIANATVGVIQESNAEKAIEALKVYSPDMVHVLRNGHWVTIDASNLVPGDIIELRVGDKVPADARIISISSRSLKLNQSMLTGESESVDKQVGPIPRKESPVRQDMHNMVFAGTTVVNGSSRCVVTATGLRSAIGEIQTSITSQIAEKTPLKVKLDDFGDMLAKVISIICILVWIINIRHFNEPSHRGWMHGAIYYFKIAVALAVAAIPEGLAVVITTCLALGTKKMAQKNAIVRNLPSVETLGCTSVVCSDKTGTLTTNKMSVTRFAVLESANEIDEYTVEGTGYSPSGVVRDSLGKEIQNLASRVDPVRELMEISVCCNGAHIEYKDNNYACIGEPTEAALLALVERVGTADSTFNMFKNEPHKPELSISACRHSYESTLEKLDVYEFTRTRKSMSVVVQRKHTPEIQLFAKGAPENILARSSRVRIGNKTVPLTDDIRNVILNTVRSYTEEQALRVLGMALVEHFQPPHLNDDSVDYELYESDMIFVGIVGMLDPPRPEVPGSIAKCDEAGIRVVMITGDNQGTAESIARTIGILKPEQSAQGLSYTGSQFMSMNDEERLEAAKTARVFSRVEPHHKLMLVELLRSAGAVVAMSGDGINDAPALKRADIGVAMGSGTDVAKLAADMVLADDNFATITMAVEEGRQIYSNTKQFIRYLISSNIGEVVSIFLTVLLNLPEALIPVQLLWVNLVTDGLPATALGFNPPDKSIMRQPPRKASEPIVSGWLLFRYLIVGTYVGVATVFGYVWFYMYGGERSPLITFHDLSHFHQCEASFPSTFDCNMFTDTRSEIASTISLSILVTIEMFNAINSLSENASLLQLPLWKNMYLVYAVILSMALHLTILYVPFLNTVFSVVPLTNHEWAAVVLISLPVIFIDEGLKLVSRALEPSPSSYRTFEAGTNRKKSE
ncbi:hypothetical protein H4219_004205 [Mycoemilia scoparia]|uniref:Calcium-transporting ATPase n=1 Tax=Mycoemilia scoparia TaxID=417184 RepID=A0A9W8DRH8_9FUNG|nr:hypothetical protein H4219_004205 [Mycoemilia scoparia]